MKWTLDGGRPILALRVIALSGIWEQVRNATLRSYTKPHPVTPNRSSHAMPDSPLEIVV